jgi:NitT/TauT family transport system permease protein
MMMSVSGGWFFVVASEAITVSGQTIDLPGIGSYIATAIAERSLPAIGWAILTMLLVILVYDQILFRPLLAWSYRFRNETTGEDEPERPWFLILLQRARLFDLLRAAFRALREAAARRRPATAGRAAAAPWRPPPWLGRAVDLAILALALAAAAKIAQFVLGALGPAEIGRAFTLGLATALRVLVLIALASLVWVPVGVWIGLRPDLARRAQPIVQFLAAFPANLFFPIAVAAILRFHLNVEVWVSPLMILGTQWYILFNVIAGASGIPTDLHYAARNLGVSRALWWRRVILPGIFPSYITGALTAAGGSWNASIVSEVVRWGDTTLTATGIGAYIARATDGGDFPRIALGVAVLCLYVILLNRLVWRRLYDLAAERLRLD